jgi:anthranilate phosphoribosyltransferase
MLKYVYDYIHLYNISLYVYAYRALASIQSVVEKSQKIWDEKKTEKKTESLIDISKDMNVIKNTVII